MKPRTFDRTSTILQVAKKALSLRADLVAEAIPKFASEKVHNSGSVSSVAKKELA